jgi:hypothetical protein
LLVPAAVWAGPASTGSPLLPILSNLSGPQGLLGSLVPTLVAGPAASGGPRFSPPPATGYAGYASGTVLSTTVGGVVDLLRLNVASADAAYRSGASGGPVSDETGRPTVPALPDRGASAHGAGLNVTALGGLGLGPLVGSTAEAVAPPSSGPVTKETANLALDPVVRASLLRGQAEARSPTQGCVLGTNLASGTGQVGGIVVGGAAPGLGLLSAGAGDPAQGTSRTSARTALVPSGGLGAGGGPALALLSEVRQTVAPVTLLAGTPAQFTLVVGGEWVLRARADGRAGSVSYGPEGGGSVTPVVRVLGADGHEITGLALSHAPGTAGQTLDVPGVAEIAIGEQPRPLVGAAGALPSGGPTTTAAAVDVARVKLLAGGAEVRIGHMEVAASVPQGGVSCPGPQVTVHAQPAMVPAGVQGDLAVTVTNPNAGQLDDLNLDVILSATPGLTFEPGSGSMALGSLAPGQSREVHLKVRPAAGSPAGRITATAKVQGRYHLASPGETAVEVPVTGEASGAFFDVIPIVGADRQNPTPPVPAPAPAPPRRQATAKAPARPAAQIPAAPTAPAFTPAPIPAPAAAPAPAAPAGFVAVPDTTGLPLQEALDLLRRAGFTVAVGEAKNAGPGPADRVVAQLPAPGTMAPPSSTVTVLVRPTSAVGTLPGEDQPERSGWAVIALLLALGVGAIILFVGQGLRRAG